MSSIYLFSRSSKVLSFFKKLRNSKLYSLVIYNPANYKNILKNISGDTFVYIDISGFKAGERKTLITYITRQKRFDYGIIDPEDSIPDPASLFFKGASDYLGKNAVTGEISTSRVKAAVNFYMVEEVEEDPETEEKDSDFPVMLSGYNWDKIKTGNDYTFCMLFIEIDILQEWMEKSGKAHIEEVMESFYAHLHRIITPLNGRLWMKTEYGGLVLFPYNGSCTSVIIECMKVIMNRIIFSAEEYTYNTILTYRMALDIGNTKYLASGKTGNIISDSVNFIFHMGKKYTKPGNLYLTGRIFEDIPPGLTSHFTATERFENRNIYRMKLPAFK